MSRIHHPSRRQACPHAAPRCPGQGRPRDRGRRRDEYAKTLGITPELWVGDFDSVTDELEAEFAAIPQNRYPQDKDNTDGELAVAEALSRGATSLVLAGAFGGRGDHAFLHVALAIRGRRKDCRSSSPAAIRKPIRCCPARATSTSRMARCSASSASRTFPACPLWAPDGRSTASRCHSAHRSPSPTRCAATCASRSPLAARCSLPTHTRARTSRFNGSSTSDARRHRADVRRHAVARRRRIVGVGRRPHRAGRPQRFRKIVAPEGRGRPDRAAGWRNFPPAFRNHPLPAADAGHGRLRHRPRLCRGGPRSR